VPVLRQHHALELLREGVHQRDHLRRASHREGPAGHEIHLDIDHQQAVVRARLEAEVEVGEGRAALLRGDASILEREHALGSTHLRRGHAR